MKIKIFKINIFVKEDNWDNQDDFKEIRQHLVQEVSDWTEVTSDEYYRIKNHVDELNELEKKQKTSNYLFLASDSHVWIKGMLADIVKKEEEKLRAQEEIEQKRLAQKRKNDELKLARKRERLEKQYQKLQKELGKS